MPRLLTSFYRLTEQTAHFVRKDHLNISFTVGSLRKMKTKVTYKFT